MDIIAAHQQGLIERLDEECDALGGRAKDFGQRAVVLHHLYDHSVGAHGWALLEARRQLELMGLIAKLTKRAKAIWWSSRRRDTALASVECLATALGEDARRRCVEAYRAYRLTATAALEELAGQRLPPELALMLGECHARRRAGMPLSRISREQLLQTSEDHVAGEGAAITDALSALPEKRLAAIAVKSLRAGVALHDFARAEKKGWSRVERFVREHAALPAGFRANPAQHFYALQHGLAEKKRKEWRNACDAASDTVALAA